MGVAAVWSFGDVAGLWKFGSKVAGGMARLVWWTGRGGRLRGMGVVVDGRLVGVKAIGYWMLRVRVFEDLWLCAVCCGRWRGGLDGI